MKRVRRIVAAAAALLGLSAMPAFGSGGPPAVPQYVDSHGGTAAELARLYRGRLGIVMARADAPILYLDWRLLHGLPVGRAAGELLAPPPCCTLDEEGYPRDADEPDVPPWPAARALVLGPDDQYRYIPTGRPGPYYTTTPNCFDEAFESAAATLRERIARYGAANPAVRAWLATQDAVFAACGNEGVVLPPPMADAPAWLKADRAYQEAAFALYNYRNAEAAIRFAAIAGDPASPWRHMGVYLGVRALHREAIDSPTPESFARARRVIAGLAATPPGTYGRGEAAKMRRWLDFRERPAALLAELDRELTAREVPADPLLGLTDYLRLGSGAQTPPDAADWIMTLRSGDRPRALAHARARWGETRDPAWLIGALSLANPDDEDAAALAADAGRIAISAPAGLSARYHLIRLTLATADPAESRARLDAILARSDLTLTERNLFTAERAAVAANLDDLARHAVRRPYCVAPSVADCLGEGWANAESMLARSGGEWVGLGPDSMAIIDRLPLADRVALSRSARLPAPLRLDVALTSFARAVQLQDEAAIDILARDLAVLLPQMRRDWQAIPARRPGPDRRFAIFFAMAKIPGLRPDLATFVRPHGTIAQFRGYWLDWMILPRGRTPEPAEFPAPQGYWPGGYEWSDAEGEGDLVCFGRCGAGAFPLRMPPFVAARAARARAERAAFVGTITSLWGGHEHPAFPPGTVSVWEETLAYARAHPRDPRAPEALYWLIRIARWGGNHDHSGRRAFQLLHRRYPGSSWARRSPFYYDDLGS